MENTVIHITGLSGSGKTTLGLKLKKAGFFVIDTDDIDDENKKDELKKIKNMSTDKQLDKFYDKIDVINSRDFSNIIKNHKIIIIVGMIIRIDLVMEHLDDSYKLYGYFMVVDPIQIYKQLNLRTLEDIHKNIQHIRTDIKNINNLSDLNKFDILLGVRHKVRGSFPTNIKKIKDMISKQKEKARKQKYKIMKPDKIYDDILNRFTRLI
jgi:hypothetical protein